MRERRSAAWLRLAVVLLLSLWATCAAAAPRIGVVTMQPGEIFFERFGHDAIVVEDPATGEAVSYNYGYFDPSEPDFLARFVEGRMRYRLVALPLEDDLKYYRDTGRGVSVQWLDLTDAEATSLAQALAVNARPENAYYGYDYFLDNCATRVRDMLDRALGGALKRQISGRSHGLTYRIEATRLASPAPWMWLGFDIGLGPAADQRLSLWDESFVPMRLADALRETRGTTGRPLVASEQVLLPHRLPPEPAGGPRPWWPWALAGLAAAAAVLALGRRRPRLAAGVSLATWLGCGLLAIVMLFIWFGTGHRFGWANRNLLLFSPVCWLLLPGAWAALRGRLPGRLFEIAGYVLLGSGVLALFVHWLAFQPQDNVRWIALMLPLHAACWWALRRR